MQNCSLTEEYSAVSHIQASAARASGSYVGDAVDAALFARLVAALDIGVLAGAATATLSWEHCSASASSDSAWAAVSSASCISSAFASASNGKVGLLELRPSQHSAVLQYVRPRVDTATSTWTGAVVAFGGPVLNSPATSYDSADVVQTVVY